MYIDRAMLKADARAAIRESKTSPYLTALIYIVIVYILRALETKLTGIDVDYDTMMSILQSGDYERWLNLVMAQRPGAPAEIIGLLLSVMTLVVGTGFIIYTLLVSRRMPNAVGNLFDGFGMFFKILGLYILEGIFVWLWSLLFVIPGVIAAYSYRQAVFLLIDHPEMRIIECIRESKRMMRGHKWELFVLDLSFLGWYILSIIPFVEVYVAPYTNVAYAGYYNALLGVGNTQTPPDGGRRDAPPRGEDAWNKNDRNRGSKPPWEY